MADENKETTLDEATEDMTNAADVEESSEETPEETPEATPEEIPEAASEDVSEVEPPEAEMASQPPAELEQDAVADEETAVFDSAVLPVDPEGLESTNMNLLMDVSLLITVELGRKEMKFNDILQLGKGSLVELSKVADEPVDIYVNQSKVAEGEVVVVDDHFGVRITRLLNSERLKRSG